MRNQLVRAGHRVTCGFVLLGLGCRAPAPFRARPDRREEARSTYERLCASCHGSDGRGAGPVAGALTVQPADLTTLAERHGGEFPRDHVIAVIAGEREVGAHGTREMPVWSQRFGPGLGGAPSIYARRRLQLLADHIESLQRRR